MIEFLLVTIALIIVVNVVKPGRTPPLANPLVIERLGFYHMMLAPQLNLAQPLIEDIAKRLGKPADPVQCSATLCFEIHDEDVTAHGQESYLLAITQRNGMLYFQACAPDKSDELRSFVEKVLRDISAHDAPDEQLNTHISATAHEIVQQHRGSISNISI